MKTTSSILLIYHYPSFDDASTIMEHIDAFGKYSDFNIIKVNTDLGFPKYLNSIEFSAIILHYSLFGTFPFKLNNNFSSYLFRKNKCIKIAFFQDEMQFCQQRFDFINKANIKVIYSLLEEEYFNEVYKMNSYAKDIRKTLGSYFVISNEGLEIIIENLCREYSEFIFNDDAGIRQIQIKATSEEFKLNLLQKYYRRGL